MLDPKTALEIARSLVVGYIEEYDTEDEKDMTSDNDDGRGSGDDKSSFYHRNRRSSSLSGSDSEGTSHRNSRATTPRASSLSQSTTPSAFTPSRAVLRLGRLTSFSGDGGGNNSDDPGAAAAKMRRFAGGAGGGRSSSIGESRSGRAKSTGSESDSSENTVRDSFGRRVSLGAKSKASAAAVAAARGGASSAGLTAAAVGPGVKLSAEAAAIMNARSPVPAGDDDSAERTDRNNSAPVSGGLKPASAPLPPKPVLTRDTTAPEMSRADGPGSQVESTRRPLRSASVGADGPLVFDRPVTPRWMEVCLRGIVFFGERVGVSGLGRWRTSCFCDAGGSALPRRQALRGSVVRRCQLCQPGASRLH